MIINVAREYWPDIYGKVLQDYDNDTPINKLKLERLTGDVTYTP